MWPLLKSACKPRFFYTLELAASEYFCNFPKRRLHIDLLASSVKVEKIRQGYATPSPLPYVTSVRIIAYKKRLFPFLCHYDCCGLTSVCDNKFLATDGTCLLKSCLFFPLLLAFRFREQHSESSASISPHP